MIWNVIIGAILALLCGTTTAEKLLIFFGYAILMAVMEVVETLKKSKEDETV